MGCCTSVTASRMTDAYGASTHKGCHAAESDESDESDESGGSDQSDQSDQTDKSDDAIDAGACLQVIRTACRSRRGEAPEGSPVFSPGVKARSAEDRGRGCREKYTTPPGCRTYQGVRQPVRPPGGVVG